MHGILSPAARTPVRCVLLVCALSQLPFAAPAQTLVTTGPFASVAPSVSDDDYAPSLAGWSFGVFNSAIGIRGSGGWHFGQRALDTAFSSTAPRATVMKGWAADGDLVLRLDGTHWGTRAPTAAGFGFIGYGVLGRLVPGAPTTVAQSWSFGGGLAVPLMSAIEISAEARHRRPFVNRETQAVPFGARMEYRAGLSLRFGGRSRRGPHWNGAIPGLPRLPRDPSRTGRRDEPRRGGTTVPISLPTGSGARVVPTASQYLGTPYRYGGTSPTTGFDCSGFLQYVFARHDVRLPRTSRAMAAVGTRLDPDFSHLSPGDLVMFAEKGARISHVAMYVGGNRIIHASSSAGEVLYDDLGTPRGRWFVRRLVAARRVTPDGRGVVADLAAALVGTGLLQLPLDPPDHAPKR